MAIKDETHPSPAAENSNCENCGNEITGQTVRTADDYELCEPCAKGLASESPAAETPAERYVQVCGWCRQTYDFYKQSIHCPHDEVHAAVTQLQAELAAAQKEIARVRREAFEEAARYVHGPQAPDHAPNLCATLNELAEGIRALSGARDRADEAEA